MARVNRQDRASADPRAEGNDLKREHFQKIQRARIIVAVGQVVCEQGAAGATIAEVVLRAGVSRRTFYEHFTNRDECLSAAMRDALTRVCERTLAVWSSSGGDWRARARSSLARLLDLFEEDLVLARLLVVESLSAGHRMLAERARVLEGVIDALEEQVSRGEVAGERAGPQTNGTFTRLSLEGALGGMLAVLHARISQGAAGNLLELTGPLMGMLVLPIYGPAAARQESARPVPAFAAGHEIDRRPRSLSRSEPFTDRGMRFTYRTIRVLWAIRTNPGSSNRQIAALAGITDQGQVSKLLSRLERHGMIVNARVEVEPGRANAWTLTLAAWQLTSRIEVASA